MVRTAALALALASGDPWADFRDVPRSDYEGVVWAFEGNSGPSYYVMKADMTTGLYGVTVWMRGDHSRDKAVKYRSSIWRVTLNCNGYYSINAGSTYAADGSVLSEWDSPGQNKAIRPGTMYDSMQIMLCPRK